MGIRTACMAVLLACASSTLGAQSATDPPQGARVRITTHGGVVIIGRVLALTPDSVRMLIDRQETAWLPVGEIRSFAVSQGVHRWRGAKRGLLVGGVAGVALLTFAIHADMNATTDIMIPGTLLAAPAAVVITLVGAGVGA